MLKLYNFLFLMGSSLVTIYGASMGICAQVFVFAALLYWGLFRSVVFTALADFEPFWAILFSIIGAGMGKAFSVSSLKNVTLYHGLWYVPLPSYAFTGVVLCSFWFYTYWEATQAAIWTWFGVYQGLSVVWYITLYLVRRNALKELKAMGKTFMDDAHATFPDLQSQTFYFVAVAGYATSVTLGQLARLAPTTLIPAANLDIYVNAISVGTGVVYIIVFYFVTSNGWLAKTLGRIIDWIRGPALAPSDVPTTTASNPYLPQYRPVATTDK
jgi:hypothetical protein